jgi:methionyl-tRNA formyltransferase
MSKTILFFGNERIATGVSTQAPTLRSLVNNGYEVAAVIANQSESRSRKPRPLEVQAVAEENGIPVFTPDRPGDIKTELAAFGAEAAVLVAYGRIVPQSVIDIFPKGIINIHPSLLPAHRGPTPIEHAILQGDEQTGVSLMSLVKEMDAGPVYAQRSVKLDGTETKQDLADQLLAMGGEVLLEHLPSILDGSLAATPQDDSLATYDSLLKKEDGRIDWTKPAGQIEREIRAFAGWPRSMTRLAGKDVVITGGYVDKISTTTGKALAQDRRIVVGCGQDSFVVTSLQPAGGKEMTAEAFLAGHNNSL